ncbi:FadR/GntR family transcriptional regulator [Tessaracoccus sp. OH4464_COT-324]|uniref:FadR/GntR family transcriptional regulator n=1 Tax=Tessaracoccus sp. OH4464_COT-324 TaxID=2491059 RepID=UPI000F63FC3C|nr:FCD domain-containing protein [Tessaracoccus sp. OH4464_COT-324]RRD46366.1 FadR family transcriptional regulator [Tessaracoccus sp. OH4464_COT-324]
MNLLDAQLRPQTRPQTQAASTLSAIKDYILLSNLQPGDPLPTESQMCESLGVSRSSVREAVRTLSALDIVEVRHGHGMFVGNVSMHPMVELLVFRGMLNPGDDYRSLAEIVEVRQALDHAFAADVCGTWSGKHSDEMHQSVTEMETLAKLGKPFPEQDRLFHSRLLAPLSNQLFRQLTEAFWDVHTLTAPRLGIARPVDILETAKAHRSMLEAAEAGDVEAYRAAVTQHYAPLLRNLRGAEYEASH